MGQGAAQEGRVLWRWRFYEYLLGGWPAMRYGYSFSFSNHSETDLSLSTLPMIPMNEGGGVKTTMQATL